MFDRFADGSPVGDAVPYFDGETHHLFILTPDAGTHYFPERLKTSWRHVVSADLLDWEELPVALSPGPAGSPDCGGVWTGSVIDGRDGVLHAFYTGHNPGAETPQTICHATSRDGIAWTKDQRNPISVPESATFAETDWRDPFVLWNDEEQCWWMLICARLRSGLATSQGVIAFARSESLQSWSGFSTLHAPFLVHAPECPELFRLGDGWVLAYSRLNDRRGTVYRHSGSPSGPWRDSKDTMADGLGWYAAKSLTDSRGRRVAFGWIPDKDPGRTDASNPWLWAGDLASPRLLSADEDGGVAIGMLPEVRESLSRRAAVSSRALSGVWSSDDGGYAVSAAGVTAVMFMSADAPVDEACHRLELTFGDLQDVQQVGFVARTDPELRNGVGVLYSPATRIMRLFSLDRTASSTEQEYASMHLLYAPVFQTALSDGGDSLRLDVLLRNDLVETFVDGRQCATLRSTSDDVGLALVVVDGDCSVSLTRWAASDCG